METTYIIDQWCFWPTAITTNGGGGEWLWTRLHIKNGEVVARYTL